MSEDLTTDDFLGGRIALRQHKKGYRVTMDSVLLAAGIPAVSGQQVLDLGCGSGAAALCLAARVDGVGVTGLELQPTLAALARENTRANNLDARITIIDGDVSCPPPGLANTRFDHVMANPPYGRAGSGVLPPDPVKAVARVESHARLPVWIALAGQLLRPGGTFTLVHRADRCHEITALMRSEFGCVTVFPLWPGPEHSRPYKRIIVQGVRGAGDALVISSGIVIHAGHGGYTVPVEDILRGGAAMAVR